MSYFVWGKFDTIPSEHFFFPTPITAQVSSGKGHELKPLETAVKALSNCRYLGPIGV